MEELNFNTGSSAVFVNINTALVTRISDQEPIYPHNYTLNTELLTYISQFCEKYEIRYLILVGNPDFSFVNGLTHLEKYTLFLSDLVSKCSIHMNSDPTNKIMVNIINGCPVLKDSRWQVPNASLSFYLAKDYKIDIARSVVVTADHLDEEFAKNSHIKIRFTQEELKKRALEGAFARQANYEKLFP